ncbi:MAG: ATP-binding protein, partial [Bacteroidales bacterium]|nr:ATP-binding protein [Bacteroidales bacterium]
YEEDKNGGLTSNNVWSINEDAKGNIWIATLGGGIVLYDYTIDGFKSLPNNGTLTLSTQFIGQIYKLSNGNMFIATASGVAFYDTQEQRYKHHPSSNKAEPLSISSKTVNGVFEYSRGLLWVATREGLVVFDPNSEYIKSFTMKDGLPEDVVNCIQEDEFHSIWVSKSTGFSQIIVNKLMTDTQYDFQIYDFTEEDGLQAKEFNPDASFKTSKGELIFGGPNGFNLFKSKDIIYNKILPTVVFTDFQVYNQSLSPDSKVCQVKLLDSSIISTKSIELKHALNVFSIGFTALDFFIPHKIKYAYKLEGFNEQWILLDADQPRVTYTNLNPGDYYFQVKASNSDGLWNPEYAELHIKVLPPGYASPMAYFVYVILLISLIVYFRFRMIRNQSIRFANEKERLIARRNHEMDEMKFRFLTNVSHEFRTPLTLIMSPLDRLLKKSNSLSDRRLLEIIDRNAKSLLALVNQLLDVRQLALNGLRYHPASGDVVSFLKEVIHNFDDAFQKKNIFYEFDSSADYFKFNFDKEKLDKVIMNLLTNAFKFTPEGGRVSVKLRVADDENSITISVADNGVGIAVEDIENIFIRFYQSEGNKKLGLSGSGVGLNLARELVQLLKGTIQVNSKQGEGARFIVNMPVDKSIIKRVGDINEEEVDISGANKLLLLNKKKTKTSILLVEDNLDFRMFMVETLHEKFEVFQASDGKAGLDMAHKKYPDLIISDVTMPIMDGLEMCKLLRDDIRTSHIPLMLLTARTADEDKIKGLEIGADDYITKPFNMDFLLLKVDKLIEKRVKMQQQFQKTVDINPSEVQITTKDEKLIKKALHIVEKNISEPKFSVVDVCHELGMSRVYLYKKLLSITGKTPVEFIRIIRLKRGTQLLKKSQMNIAEVAYEVGFNSPRYFSKYFKEEYGMLPTEWMKKNGA